MRVLLAPMEGVVNHSMRTVLTQIGGIDRCVTEFIRVTETVFPSHVFYRFSPELKNGGMTPSGVPVYVQLLGSHLEAMAGNAAVAVECGAPGIDINFGCPSKLVNRNGGGSILLRTPQVLFDITQAVRQAVPDHIPVTVKTRLGYEDSSLFTDIIQAIFAANPSELAIHARTKADGYKPPAHWHLLKNVQANSPIPVIANGEVWNVDDYKSCYAQSGCDDIMIGRGILARPDLPNRIKQVESHQPEELLPWQDIIKVMVQFFDLCREHYAQEHMGNPVKQWLVYLKKGYAELGPVFDDIKRLRKADEVRDALLKYLD